MRSQVEENKTCHFCLMQGQQLLICSRCRTVRYCSRPCQKAHWKEVHRQECHSPIMDQTDKHRPPNSDPWKNHHHSRQQQQQHDISNSIKYQSIVKELYSEVQRDSFSLEEAYTRMRRAQEEVDRLNSELKVMRESRSKTNKSYTSLHTRNDRIRQHPNNYKLSDISSMVLVQKLHNQWKLVVEDLTNIHCYSFCLSPFSQQITDIPKEQDVYLSIVPSSVSSSRTQVTLHLVHTNDNKLYTSDSAIHPNVLVSIDIAGEMAIDSNNIRVAHTADCITLRLMYDKEQQSHLEYQQTMPKTTPLHLLKEILACKSCHSKLFTDSIPEVERILPLPTGYWDEISDYLMCYEGDSTVAFTSSSYNTAIQGCILEDSSVYVLHKKHLGSNVEVLAIEGYGEQFERPMKRNDKTNPSNSSNISSEEDILAQGTTNAIPVAFSGGGGGVLYRGERQWRDLTGGGATLCCSQCCSILGFASNTTDNYSTDPPFRLYKHRLLISSGVCHHTCGTFIAHQMVRYAEGQAVFTFYIMREKSSCPDRLVMKPNCLLLKLISWDTRIAVCNPEEETTADSFRFQNAVKVIFQERILPYEVDPLPLSPLLFWNNIDLCCPPKSDSTNKSRNEASVHEKNSQGTEIPRTTASVKIFLLWDEWNELRDDLLSKRFPSSIAAGTIQMNSEMNSSSNDGRRKGFFEGVSFLPLN